MDTDMKDPTQQALVDTKKTAVLSDTPKQQGRRIFLIVGQVLLEHGRWVLPRGLVVVVGGGGAGAPCLEGLWCCSSPWEA